MWWDETEKTDFYLQLFIDLKSLHMNSPNFWHFIYQLGTILYRNHMVPDQQVAHEIPNHWNSPGFRNNFP